MVRNLLHICFICYAYFICIGPPILKLKQKAYVIAGTTFSLDCIVTYDSRSPYRLWFRWFKDSTRIFNNNEWTFGKFLSGQDQHTITETFVLAFLDLNVNRHNGTYTCSVDDSISTTVSQNFTLIVESKY